MIGGEGNIVEVKGLHKYYGENHILKGVNFTALKGQLISIIGRSGCGKTTFLRCLNCLEIMDEGSINIAGISISRKGDSVEEMMKYSQIASDLKTNITMPFYGYEKVKSIDEDFQIKAEALRKQVGMLFQSFNLFPHMTVIENITTPQIIVQKKSNEEARHRAVSMLKKVGMEKFVNRMPGKLSGGQKQRVAIARALAMNPQVMLYDEPTSALDPELVDEVSQVMTQLNKEGMTQIVVTHSMHFARYASDLVVYMHEGQIVEIGKPEQIFNKPQDPRTKEYLKIFHD